jgi:hypothetical protein
MPNNDPLKNVRAAILFGMAVVFIIVVAIAVFSILFSAVPH